ncbi:MAG: hypothetical protein A2Z30_07585 [Chloroflexi bacterium RBG_16_64_43]|nr:MAG: hypothetical protein A2Z30_07585 [Chloroflexi bacterium RBG_16_64_43]
MELDPPGASDAENPVHVLGVRVDALDIPRAVARVRDWIEHDKPHYVCVTSAHGILECWQDPLLRRVFNGSGMTTPDGMSLVWLLRLRGRRGTRRVYGPDLMNAICEASLSAGWRHFLYGGGPGVPEALAARLGRRYSGLAIAGTCSPPFRPLNAAEEEAIAARINQVHPHVVWVGLSTPKQERWMAAHLGRINAPVFIGVGAAFDFLSGTKPQAPRWIQRSGLEWLFRLATEPRRLWRRYAQYPLFGLLVAAESLGLLRVDPEAP